MSRQNKGNNKKDDPRRIRQIYPQDDEGIKVPEQGREEPSEKIVAIRIVSIAVVMIVSVILAMAGGIGLALWDEGRTVGELGAIVFAGEMDVAVAQTEEPGESAIKIADEDNADGEDAVPPEQEEPEDDPGDYGQTIDSGYEGAGSIAKAGSEDVIDVADDTAPVVIDPLADYPLPFTTVDESYFTDALFIGDSRLQGFGFWSGIPATYYCATGFHVYKYETTDVVQTENGKVPIFDAMPYDAFTKVYIKVGLNELGYGTEENFEKTYADLIARIREYEPRAIIFVHAILPVTLEKSNTDSAHNNANIAARNAALEQFAREQKAYFLDAGPFLSDADGNLRPEMTGDGIHLKPEYMKLWKEYLFEHGIVIE